MIGPVRAPSADDFRALARSSPWLFTTLHFTHRPTDLRRIGPAEAWLQRPGLLRVVDENGAHIVSGVPYTRARLATDGTSPEWSVSPPQQHEPTRRLDGLVADRPAGPDVDDDDPMWQSYVWVAMLDPVELATGTRLSELAATERRGRETWWARAEAVEGYEPRCSCCPLLWGAVSDRIEFGADGVRPRGSYPDGWLVGFDRRTGVMVSSEPIGGDGTAPGFINEIHAVDVSLDPALFRSQPEPGQPTEPRRQRRGRRRGPGQ